MSGKKSSFPEIRILCLILALLIPSLACQLPFLSNQGGSQNSNITNKLIREQTEQAAISSTLESRAAAAISDTQSAQTRLDQEQTIAAAQSLLQVAQDAATRSVMEAQQQATLNAGIALQNQQYGTQTAIAETQSQTPPKIISIQFRDYIKADSSKYLGQLAFTDSNGNIDRLVLTVIHAINFDSMDYDPTEFIISGDKYDGVIQLEIRCKVKQQVTLRATLYDTTGFNSNNKEFTFVCN